MLGNDFTHANFSVDDLAKAKQFYVDVLGFSVVKESPYEMLLESGKGSKVNIYHKPDHKAWDSTVFGIEVDDVDAAVAELTSLGVQIEKLEGSDESGVIRHPEMGEATWFKDPASNWICVSHTP